MANFKDITGQRFGRLVAIRPDRTDNFGQKMWLCKCDCNKSTIVRGYELRSGGTKSCGCRARRWRHGHIKPNKTPPLYSIWRSMRARCTNPNNKAFKNYGGRGIKICRQWDDFSVFLTDVGKRPPNRVLDRINNDGPYAPDNVRWATHKQSANNKRPQRKRSTIDEFTTTELITELKRRIHLTRVRVPYNL